MVQLEENGLLPGIYRLYFIYMTQDNPIHHHTSPLHSTPLSTNARGTTAALTLFVSAFACLPWQQHDNLYTLRSDPWPSLRLISSSEPSWLKKAR